MKDSKKYFKNLIILVISFILINSSAFALDKVQNVRIMLMPYGPILSPRGDEIVFDFIWKRNDKAGSDIGILSLKNDAIKIITKSGLEGSLNESPTWSKNSKHILFKSTRKEGMGLFSSNLETLKEKVLVFLQDDENNENKKYIETPYLYPIWFPLSDKILFIKSIANKNYRHDRDTILYLGYVYDLKGKKAKKIAEGISGSVTFRHTWSVSYNGNYVFYTKKDNKYNNIWLSNLLKGRSSEQRLTEGYDVIYLRASPVKNELLFVAKGDNKNSWALYKLNLKTRKEEKLFESNNYNLGFPSWSQDGNQIVFISKGSINIMDVNKRGIIAELKIDMETITFPIVIKDRKVVFYHKHSSIWSIDMEGKTPKKYSPRKGRINTTFRTFLHIMQNY